MESPAEPVMERYRLFLSSPSDVLIERDRAEAVVKRVNARRLDRPQFELVRWELDYYGAQTDFQSQIPKPSECELVICIFWKRLGSDLPDKYARSDGTLPTGTEYEFEEALHGAAANPHKLPDVLVYRKTAEVTFSATTLDFERAQYDRFMAFWQRWFRNEKGHFLAGFQSFGTSDEFEAVFERNLDAWLRDRETEITWTKGSPYRGLEPFDVEHAPIFFGRRREVERTRARLIASATGGKPFLLITGASGAGKSSLARAGLIPRLAQAGGLSTLAAALRWTIFTPGQIAASWSAGLAARLLEKGAIGDELRAGDFNTEDALAGQLARADASACAPIVASLRRAGEKMAAAEKRSVAPRVALLVLIDQLEELFAWGADAATAFLTLLQRLCRLPDVPVLILATMRSDFQHRLADFPILATLAGRSDIKGPYEGEQTLELLLPSPSDLRDTILNPARAAGLTFEVSGERDLAQLIEAEARPEAMPSVQFLLAELYAARADSTLTLAAFDTLGGVNGVMATRGEAMYLAQDPPVRAAFPRIVRALVTQVRDDVPASTRRVPERVFAGDAPAVRMIDALRQARLIISDRGELRFAHDRLLTGWLRLKEQIAEEQRLFAARERLEQYCARWVEAGRNGYWLEGFALAEGRELLAKWDPRGLSDRQPELPAYIGASDRREKRGRRIMQAIGWSVAAVLALFAAVFLHLWQQTAQAQKATQASLWIAQSQGHLREGNIEAAVDRADRAFTSLPTEAHRSTLLSVLLELPPHLVSVARLGRSSEALAWIDGTTLAFAAGSLRAFAPFAAGGTPDEGWTLPAATPPQQPGPTVLALHAIGADRLVAVFDDGAVALATRAPGAARRYANAMPLGRGAHAVAVGAGAATVVAAGADDSIALIRCDWALPETCRAQTLGELRGRAVAINPDGTRIAVGDADGNVTLFDLAGNVVRSSQQIGARIVALGWAAQRDWVAAGTAEGELVVFDAALPATEPPLARERFGERPLPVLAWSPKGLDLAFVCNGASACLLQGDDKDRRFAPAIRLGTHANTVTRLAFAPGGRHVASSSTDGTIRVWDLVPNTEASYALYASEPAELSTVATAPDGKWIAAGAKDGAIRLWAADGGGAAKPFKPPAESEVQALGWSRNGRLAALHENETVSLITDHVQRPPIALGQLGPRSRFAWTDDGTVALPLRDGGIALVAVDRMSDQPPRLPTERVASGLAADPARRVVFSGYQSGEVDAWDLATGKPETMRDTRPNRIRNIGPGSLSVSPDGRWLATSGADGFVPVYDVQSRTSRLSLETESTDTITVAFSPDGRRLAALSADNRLYVWEFADGAASRFLTVGAVPSRAASGNAPQRDERASWLDWTANDSIAIVSGGADVTVIQLDPAKWRRRVDGLVQKQFGQ
jgi:WD40 repeat protein